MSHKTHMNSNRESHSGIVPSKRRSGRTKARGPKETVAVNQGERQSVDTRTGLRAERVGKQRSI